MVFKRTFFFTNLSLVFFFLLLAVYLLSTFLPMVCGVLGKSMDELKETDTTKFFESPEMFALIYSSPQFLDALRDILPVLLNEGYLD